MTILQINIRKSEIRGRSVRNQTSYRSRRTSKLWRRVAKVVKFRRKLPRLTGRGMRAYMAARRSILVSVHGYAEGTRRYWEWREKIAKRVRTGASSGLIRTSSLGTAAPLTRVTAASIRRRS